MHACVRVCVYACYMSVCQGSSSHAGLASASLSINNGDNDIVVATAVCTCSICACRRVGGWSMDPHDSVEHTQPTHTRIGLVQHRRAGGMSSHAHAHATFLPRARHTDMSDDRRIKPQHYLAVVWGRRRQTNTPGGSHLCIHMPRGYPRGIEVIYPSAATEWCAGFVLTRPSPATRSW